MMQLSSSEGVNSRLEEPCFRVSELKLAPRTI